MDKKRIEVALDFSRTSDEKFRMIIGELVRNGYEVYESYENYESLMLQKICLSTDDYHELREQ